MAFEYVKESELAQSFKDAQKHMAPLHEPLDEFERIARNRPHPGIAKELPKVTDGTLAALIQEQPKRVIQQIPTGKVESQDPWLNIVGGYIFEQEILKNADYVAALIQKCWALTSKCLTYGSQPAFVQFINRGDYFGTDFSLPYIKDVFLEPGKLSDRDSNVIYLRAYYQPNQIDAIIAKEKMLGKSAKERGDEYESGWDLTALAKLKDQLTEKPQEAQSPNERNKSNAPSYIQIVHAFQRGVGANFYSFDPASGNVVRRKKNKDPRGMIPIHFMYANVDLSNPLGRGIVEVSGGLQNLLDSEMQMYQYLRALMLNPPVMKFGDVAKSTIKYAPNAVWDMGMNPNNKVEIVQLESQSLAQFPQNSQMLRAQILNLNSGGGDTSIGADTVGAQQSSKTPAGVKATEAKLGAADNYIRKQFEDTWSEISETMLNLYFAERSGTQELTLDKDTAAKLRKLQPEAVSPDNVIRIDYDTETPKLKFKVDASTSSMKDDVAERDRLLELLDISQKYPQLAQIIGEDGIRELTNRIIVKTGVEDPEKIMPSEPEVDPETGQPKQQADMAMQAQQMQEAQQQIQQLQQELEATKAIPYDKAPDEIKRQMEAKAGLAPVNSNPLEDFMKSLGIKFTDLGSDAQRAILESFGLPANEQLPSELDANIRASDAATKVAQLHHQEQTAQQTHALSASDAALRIAQAGNSADQADRTHEFTVKQAETQAKQEKVKVAK